jgi:alkylation response protein AidB-like acyl-CoA dehydrogenase
MSRLDLIPDPTEAADPALEKWLDVADRVAERLRTDVVARDAAGEDPSTEIEIIRQEGLLDLAIPVGFGGGGEPHRTALEVVRRIARADASVAQVLAYHYNWLRVVASFGTATGDQALRDTVTGRWLWASPGSSREGLPALTGLTLNGVSGFATGAPISQRLFVRAVDAAGHLRLVSVAPDAPGVRIDGDWDVLGQRLSASRNVAFEDTPLAPGDLLADAGPATGPGSPRSSLGVLNFQLTFGWLHLAIAEGALLEGAGYTRTQTRKALHSLVESGAEEPFILAGYGGHLAEITALTALAGRAEQALAGLYALGDDLTATQRAQAAELIAALKVRSTEAGLAATSDLFELTGARATARRFGLDRFWRDVRTLSLHDPVSYKRHELGAWFVNGIEPIPSGYR